MLIESYSKFPLDFINENQIPVFCGSDYTRFLTEVKSEDVFWFIGKHNNITSCFISFSVKKRLVFKKGYFLTAVITFTEIDVDIEKEFLELVIEYIKENKLCDWIEQPPNWAIFRVVPSNSIYCEFGSYVIDMRGKNENELLNSFQGRNRQSITKAIRDGVIIKEGAEYLDYSMSVLLEVSKREGVKHPKKVEILKLIDILQDKIKIYTAFFNNVPQATGILFSNGYSSYGIYGGSTKQAVRGAYPLLCWYSIKDANADDVQYFDFVGARINPSPDSKYERIQQFKQHFGANMITGYLWKLTISKFKHFLYNLILHISYFLKLIKIDSDIIDQELKRAEIGKVQNRNNYQFPLVKKQST